MASVRFQNRGRQGRMPLSFYAPLMVPSGQPLHKVLPKNAVPTGKGNRDQQIGYWNEQQRWRMVKGNRKDLPSKWHFYYLGTGPHADASFRDRIDGVFWVAVANSKTEPTGLGTRKANQKPLMPEFKVNLPNSIEIVEPITPTGSRSNSRSQSRGRQSNNGSPNRGNSNKQNKSRNNSQNRNNSRSRNQSSDRGNNRGNNQDELVAAVRKALLGLGITGATASAASSGRSSKNTSGKNTPKNSRSKSPATRPSQSPKRQTERPEWKRVPDKDNSVTACFGPRDASRNFGGQAFLEDGILAHGYPQVAQLTPTPAALLFGGHVGVRELENEYQITYRYTMSVPKEEKAMELFLANVDAYKNPSSSATPKTQRKRKQKAEVTVTDSVDGVLNPDAPAFQPATAAEAVAGEPDMSRLEAYIGDGAQVQIIDEVYEEEEV
ncbi:MAG: nucleocapsid protein [Tadarida brasiliensis bat alphacoronavirus 2]|nr:MAG: nucleocapsid protein [Tadarida brasiliensis bat alphacoronavirus 2]